MNNFDFLIIYLTCGAPLAVFYFLGNYKKQSGFRVWLKTFLIFIFWLPFAFQSVERILRKKLYTSKKPFSPINDEAKISFFQKRFEEAVRRSNLPISIFEFREIFERYVALTIAAGCKSQNISKAEREIFNIAERENVESGAICLNRRNLKRLIAHQNKARQDFFYITGKLTESVSDKAGFVKFATAFFRLLKDAEAQSLFSDFLSGNLPDRTKFTVVNSEYILWNTETPKPPSAQKLLGLTTTATNLSVKD